MATMMEQFRQTLVRLASSASEQESYLRTLGTAPSADELALEFSDAFAVVKEQLGESARAVSSRLDRHLEEMSGRDYGDIWTVDALHAAPVWGQVRRLAREALHTLSGPE